MTLSDIANIASIISSVAVAASLFYLALQVRQAERNQRGQMQQGRADRVSGALLAMADTGLAPIWIKGNRNPDTLTAEEVERFLIVARAALISAEDSFLQHKAKLLDEAAFVSFAAGMRAQFAAPGLRAAWRLVSSHFGADFREFVATISAEAEAQARAAPAPDRLAQWRAALEVESPPADAPQPKPSSRP